MLSNAYFLAKFRFDTAENAPAKKLQNFVKFANFADPNPLTLTHADEILLPVRHPDLVADPLLLEGLAQELPHDRVLHVLVLLKRLPGVLLDEKPVIIYYTRSDEVL